MWHNFTEDFQRNKNRADRHKYRQNRTYYDIDTVVPNIQPIHTCQYTSLLITRCSGWLIWQQAYTTSADVKSRGASSGIFGARRGRVRRGGREEFVIGLGIDPTAQDIASDDDDDVIRHHQTRDLISNAFITPTSCSFSLAGHRRRSTADGFPGRVPRDTRSPTPSSPSSPPALHLPLPAAAARVCPTSVYRRLRVKVGT